jgi:hypothetical protein
MGSVRTATASRYIDASIATTVTAVGAGLVKPCEYLSPTAHTVSNSPASTRIAQARFIAP